MFGLYDLIRNNHMPQNLLHINPYRFYLKAKQLRLKGLANNKCYFAIFVLGIVVLYMHAHMETKNQIALFRQRRYLAYKVQETRRRGPGENGNATRLTSQERRGFQAKLDKEGYNIVASDKISLQRAIIDPRHESCLTLAYSEKLPTASVVIVFYNEAPSVILRTLHSVINRTPPALLEEVLLVDDASTRAYKTQLGGDLSEYISGAWPDGIVRLIRSEMRGGLIVARLLGARGAAGDVLVFLDAHCEAAHGWLEPLLAVIAKDKTRVVCPVIDQIAPGSMEYQAFRNIEEIKVGGFLWSMHFVWMKIPDHEAERRKTITAPIRTPTMAGGLFAIDRDYFYQVGSYDDRMQIWGGENLEMSFRVWMCGGSVEIVPCSHVGHLFRGKLPYDIPGDRDYHALNSVRLAEVWLDDYKRLFYTKRPLLINEKYQSDVTERSEMRERMKCHSFEWYLKNVYPTKFIPDENVLAWGQVRNAASNLCFDTLMRSETFAVGLSVFHCQDVSSNQIFSLTHDYEIRREQTCLTYVPTKADARLSPCAGMLGNQEWQYEQKSTRLRHVQSDICLDVTGVKSSQNVKLSPCTSSEFMRWEWQYWMGP